MKLYQMGLDDITTNSNAVKEEILKALEREGLLKESAEEISKKYAVVIYEPGWLGRIWQTMINKQVTAGLHVNVVKLV